ncbi:MAG TPA: hypothetical protein VNH65_04745 [Candidatus Acidoferrum sp.]|nr:hypothetical protein [Candidatus Acidoferrum sp.]
MRKGLLADLVLLLCGVIAARGRPDPLFFVFIRADREQGVAFLRPMIAPDIGVQLASGPLQLTPGTALRCVQSTQKQNAIVEGQTAVVSELVLDCGDYKFVVKGLDFAPRAK